MNQLLQNEDGVWEQVLEALSRDKTLSRFYKKPRYEMLAIMREWGAQVNTDLNQLFTLTQQSKIEARDAFVVQMGDERIFAVLMTLGRSMKCWIESDSSVPTLRARWKVASA